MREVALISQTMRVGHCHAHMNTGEAGQTIMTANPAAFANFRFSVPPRIMAVAPPPELLPSTTLASSRFFRLALAKARAGSRVGAWVERSGKLLVRIWRSAGASVGAERPAIEIDDQKIRGSVMYAQLVEEHRSSPIGRVVVFDVFDLPVALAFCDDHDIDVLVR